MPPLDYTVTKEEAKEFFSKIYFGQHHIPSELKPWGVGWCVNDHASMATFDFDRMTRFVFLAHDMGYRLEVMPCNMQCLKIAIWKRKREGSISERHPTIEQALEKWREHFPVSQGSPSPDGA